MRSPLEAFDRRNLLTYVSLLCGTMGMAAAAMGSAALAGGGIAAAVIADTFDGRFARRFVSDARRRDLGVQLDSLADAIAFGVAPVVCAILLTTADEPLSRAMLWTSGFGYIACAITRLAFFNVETVAAPSTPFIGLPVPVAALIWSSTLLAHPSAPATAVIIAVTAGAMVAPFRISRPGGIGLVMFTCWPLAIVIGHLMRIGSG